jgi:hypothetical protein
MIVTTPGHPFYLEHNIDNTDRPAPQGHEELAEPWVGAGDLKVGDKVRQADGTTGTVRIVKTEQKTQTMYNLDIANLDNFYVGEQGWLVHNTEPSNAWNFFPGHGLSGGSDTKQVIRLAQLMQTEGWGNLPPIKVADINGKMVVADGMHRLAAAKLTGINVQYELVSEDWLKTNTGWKSLAELEVDSMTAGNRLDKFLLQKAGFRPCP